MRGTMWLLTLACGLMLSTSGCCGYNCGRGCGCDTCDGGCGPVYGSRAPLRERGCDDCGTCDNCRGGCDACRDPEYRVPRCDTCGECSNDCGGGCQRNFCFHPFRWIGRLFWTDTYCGPRCGGNEACDECESCGHHAYPAGHDPEYRAPRCATCNHGQMYDDGQMSPADGNVAPGNSPAQPTPAPQTSRRANQSAQQYN